jgi:hypothetical protein
LPRNYETDAPGPASYQTQRNALYGVTPIPLHGRPPEHEEIDTVPYRDTRLKIEAPRYSLRGKYEIPVDDTPGPTYVPPAFGSRTTTQSIRPRLRARPGDETPSPDAYRPRTGREVGNADKSTFHGPKDRGFGHPDGLPSGADYRPDYVAYKGSGPRFTLKGAKYEPSPDQTGGYVRLPDTVRSPRFTLKGRPSLEISYS